MSDETQWRRHLRGKEPQEVAQLEAEIAASQDKAVIGRARLEVFKRRARARAFRVARADA